MTEMTREPINRYPDYQFIGDFEIDAAALCIRRDGKTTKLEPRAMALLLYLAERPDTVISREELEREIWSGRVVGYDALNNTISKLRRAFHDDPRHPEYIHTVPKVGYQLIAKVSLPKWSGSSQTVIESSSEEPSLERKLAAILCTDVANYSGLSGIDEERTHRELSACLDLMKSLIERFDGKVVNFAGDAILAEFATVSNALRCAVLVQQQLAIRCESHPKGRKMRFRIGLNLGEVIVDRDDIFGDGVIIASRLEGLAVAGGICISGSVFDAIGNKLPLAYEYLGERKVKNIEAPVRAYRAELKPGAVISLPHRTASPRAYSRKSIALVAAIMLTTISGAWLAWQHWKPVDVETQEIAKTTQDTAIPAIAVLPFKNISDDPAQEYFADGMTDDLIADLLKIANINVIARQSVFSYKDKSVSVEQIAKELGAQYVLEGSVKRVGGKIRVNANLVDVKNAESLWSERYENDASELFSLQNQVIQSIVAALSLELTNQEKSTLSRLPTDNLEAYDYFQRAERRRLVISDEQGVNHYGSLDEIELYWKAIALDPKFAQAYVGLALVGYEVWSFDATQIMPIEAARKLAYDSASKVRELDPLNPAAWSILALLQATDGQHELATESVQRAITLNPNDPEVHAARAEVLMYAGEHQAALLAVTKALKLNPKPPVYYYGLLGRAEFFNKNYEKALFWLKKAEGRAQFRHEMLMTYGELGMHDEARNEFNKVLIGRPFANLGHYRIQLAHYKRALDLDHMISALRRAGVPEHPFGFKGRAADGLNTNELETLIAGNTWVGVDYLGSEFVQQISDEGKIAFRNSNSMLVGEAWVEQDKFCVNFSANMQGRDDCGPVYHKPSGTVSGKNEYIRVALGNLYYFSLK